jgi:helix-turn-helix protein
MSALRMCELGHVSRAGMYRFDPDADQPDSDPDLRNQIQKIALEFPCYGRPRITAELKRRGWNVNHKRVGRIMREDNLLCLRRRKFGVTDYFEVFENRVAFREPAARETDRRACFLFGLFRRYGPDMAFGGFRGNVCRLAAEFCGVLEVQLPQLIRRELQFLSGFSGVSAGFVQICVPRRRAPPWPA